MKKTGQGQPLQKHEDGFEAFSEFCRTRGLQVLPATAHTVREFARDLLADGRSTKDIVAAIRAVHAAHVTASFESPTRDPEMLKDLEVLVRTGTLPELAKIHSQTPNEGSANAEFPSQTPESGAKDTLPVVTNVGEGAGALQTTVELLREVPEEEIWLQGQRSDHTRRAYRQDIRHFIKTLSIREAEELRKIDRAAVVHWVRAMQKEDPPAKPRTVRRRLSALSSLFTHLVDRRAADENPVREIKRPRVNRRTGTTHAFSKKQARKVLEAPAVTTIQGLRNRAILAVGLQVGARRSEIARLKVSDFHQNQGFWSLHFIRKGGEDLSVSVHPQVAQRIQDYLEAAGHGSDHDGPMFRPIAKKGHVKDTRRALNPDMVDRILRKSAKEVGLPHGFSAHSMRATFITTALENGASLEDVQRDVGHADPSTTKLYDRRGHNPEKSASFFANY